MADNGGIAPTQKEEQKRKSLLADVFVRLIKEKPLGTFGAGIVLLLVVVAIFADVLSPYGMTEISVFERLKPPSPDHWLGTDHLGRDLLSRIMHGARISLVVGFVTATLGTGLATAIGLVSGYAGGKIDMLIQRIIDGLLCFPIVVLVLSLIAIVGPSLWNVIMVLGFSFAYRWVRVIRSSVISIKENVYVEAARAIGVPTSRILWRHILPNIFPVVIIILTLAMGQAILIEAILSFLGFGVPPPAPSWGGMLSGIGRRYLELAPWIAFWPGLFLAIVVYGINMLGDALRDLLDPRLRGGAGRYSGVKQAIARRQPRTSSTKT